MFHQGNVLVHSSSVAKQKLTELRFELLPHQAYSTVLALTKFHLFSKFENFSAEQNFGSNKENIQTVNECFEDLDENHIREGIKKQKKRWAECVEFQGIYVEK